MARYAIRIIETLSRTVIVDDAEDLVDAMQQIRDSDICLDFCDSDGRKLEASELYHYKGAPGLVSDDAGNLDFYDHI